MIIRDILAKGILSKSKVLDYTINPYIGCEHNCTYCYARFMKRFTGHKEPWGKFIDVKINAPRLLERDIQKKKMGRVWVSGTCDPYQPIEKQLKLTRQTLEILLKHHWPVTIQTKSPLVTRDIEILREMKDVEVGLTITTADDKIREAFEPSAPSIQERIGALEMLKTQDITTFAMIAPILPGAEDLVTKLQGKVDQVLIDKMNYHYADWVYRKLKLHEMMSPKYFIAKKREFTIAFSGKNMQFKFLF